MFDKDQLSEIVLDCLGGYASVEGKFEDDAIERMRPLMKTLFLIVSVWVTWVTTIF